MSTKIYTGFRIRNTNLLDMQQRIELFRLHANAVAADDQVRLIARMLAEKTDDLALKGELSNLSVDERKQKIKELMWKVHSDILDRQHRVAQTMHRDVEIDFSFEICFVPIDPSKVIGMYFTEQPKLGKLWMSMPGVEDYHYQNQVDRPEDIPEAEWDKRGEVWHQVLGHHAPADRMFTARIVEIESCPYEIFDPKKLSLVQQYTPGLDARAEERAIIQVANERFQSLPEKERSARMVSNYMNAASYACSDEAAPRVAEIKAGILRALSESIPKEWAGA